MLSQDRWNAWGLAEGFTELEIEQACHLFEGHFKVEAKWNPSGTGVRLIRSMHARKGTLDKIEPPSSLYPFTQDGRGSMPIYWIDRAGAATPYDYIQAYDKRASYLLASDANLGVGEWKEMQGEDWNLFATSEDWKKGRYKIAGIWRLVFQDSDMPWVRQFANGREWFYTPMVEALAALGASFVVTEGYYFPRSLRLLKSWRELVEEGLSLSEDAHLPALRKMIKAMYTQTFGLLGSDKFVGDSLYRPDWRGQIVDQAAARMLFNMKTIKDRLLAPVVAVYDDCLYLPWADTETIPYVFDPRLGDKAPLAKHYRFKGSYALNDKSRSLFALAPSRFAMHIKEWEVK